MHLVLCESLVLPPDDRERSAASDGEILRPTADGMQHTWPPPVNSGILSYGWSALDRLSTSRSFGGLTRKGGIRGHAACPIRQCHWVALIHADQLPPSAIRSACSTGVSGGCGRQDLSQLSKIDGFDKVVIESRPLGMLPVGALSVPCYGDEQDVLQTGLLTNPFGDLPAVHLR